MYSRSVGVCSEALIGRTGKLPNGSYVPLKTGLANRLDFMCSLAAVDSAVAVAVDPKESRVDRDEAEIGLLNSSWFTPPGADVGRILTFTNRVDGVTLV